MSTENGQTPQHIIVEEKRNWEMELILVGLVLMGLLQAPDFITQAYTRGVAKFAVTLNMLEVISMGAWTTMAGVRILTACMLLLLVLRGFWIGLLGLNLVYPEGLDQRNLRYSPRFAAWHEKYLPDLETLARHIDRVASSVFAFAFLIIFAFISGSLFFIWASLLTAAVNKFLQLIPIPFREFFAGVAGYGLIFPLLTGGLLVAVDFFTLGYLKRIKTKWFAVPYFYVNRVLSTLTLGFLQAPLYCTLVTHVPKKIIGVILIGFALISFAFITFDLDHFIFLPGEQTPHYVETNYYDNLRQVSKTPLAHGMPTIQADIITDPFMKLYIPYLVLSNDSISAHCPDVKPLQSGPFDSAIHIGPHDNPNPIELEARITGVLDCFGTLYTVSIDSVILTDMEFHFYRHPEDDLPGIVTYIDVDYLSRGRHVLHLQPKIRYPGAGLMAGLDHYIPFWVSP